MYFKNLNRLCFLVAYFFFVSSISAQITATPDTTLCLGQSVQLQAIVGGSGYGTDNYVFETIPYSPEAYEGTEVPLFDDTYTGILDIGFDFCFIGETYDQFYIGSNGWISFGPEASLSGTYVSVPIPDTDPSVPKNCIASPWEDWDPEGVGDRIKYQTVGVAPDRKLIISWIDVPMFDCWDDTELNGTFQIVIFETTNIIENHIEFKSNCLSWFPTATQGVHNIGGTLAYTAPDRNGTTWEAELESTRFVPSGISWYEGGTLIGYGDTLTVVPTETTTYTAIVTLCDGTEYTDDVLVVVSEINEVIDITDVLCNGDENGAASIDISGPNPPFLYEWSTGDTDTEIENVEAGNYTVTVSDELGCTKEFEIVISEPDLLELPIDALIDATCFGYDDGEISFLTAGGIPPYTYSLNGGPNQTDNSFDGLPTGEYTVIVTDANGCNAETTFMIDQPDLLTLDAGPDQYILQGGSATITATTTTTDLVGVSWGPGGGTLDCPEGDICLIYTVTPNQTTTYYVSISDEAGCAAIDTITIFVEFVPEIFFPSAFSPNADNINDNFQGLGYNVIEYDLKIFNRWGEIVYETANFDYSAGWNGKYNDTESEIGSYVYQTTVKFTTGDVFNGSGSFILVR